MEYESKLTDIIASLLGVDGGFLYDTTRGIYSNQTAGKTDDASLLQVSSKLSEIVSMLAVHFHDTGGIRVNFKDLVLYGLMFEENNWLFLLHHPFLSPNMVKMTVQQVLNSKTEEKTQPEIANTTPEDHSLLDLLLDDQSEFREPMIAIKEELTSHIGPVAEVVFADAVDKWNEEAPSLERLPDLLEILEQDIDDENACMLFRENLKTIAGVNK